MPLKTCPRCGSSFLCQPENPTQCQCAGIQLSAAARKHLDESYPGACLCRRCLQQLAIPIIL